MPTQKRKLKDNNLPYNWRIKVAEMLKGEFEDINPNRVSNIVSGRVTDAKQAKKIAAAIKKIQKEQLRLKKIKFPIN